MDVEKLLKTVVDNNGIDKYDYCDGEQSSSSSDHPKDDGISLSHDALIKYNLQDEITKAYYDLRPCYSKLNFNKTPDQLTKDELKVVKKAH